ncbi:hypothetical protein EXW31_28655 (plasmid) [Bacillus mycoides]|uniref:hypothetical protein n=1 Tax=Bacillus mycoides TaxID=1405 RepID=UPI000871D753|nr:hypothetical protein [Bacillus mycoides]OFD57549.1 hypothetical protein BWGOE6_37190 [Bacillus mycoides]QWG48141.1 hypothetical protein EXW31_28655 [Bacillus mycoides]
MIKIDPQKIIDLSEEYIQQMMPIIQEKYRILKTENDINPFTGEPVVNLFEDSSGELNEELIKTILFDPFPDRYKQLYPQLEFYYKTAVLAFYDENYLKWKIKKRTISREHLARVREDNIISLNNPWVESDITHTDHIHYKKSWKNYKILTNHIKCKLDQLNHSIGKMIDYKYLTEEMRHYILCSSEIRVCPYCNRQYITTYNKNKSLRSTSDLDHFYPKVAFQLYSLSLFNFIPACSICNSRFKRAKKLKILYLYEMGFEDRVTFKVKPTYTYNINSLIGNTSDFDLVLELEDAHANNDELQGHIEMFRLEEVYQSHKDFVQELLYKRKAYSPAYKEMTEKLLNTKLSEEEFNLFLFGVMGNDKDLLNKPLSKLTIDILGLRK